MSSGVVSDYARPQDTVADEGKSEMTDAETPVSRGARRRDGEERVSFVRMFFTALSWVLLLGVALLAIVVVVIPLVTGAKPYTILTGSMEPQYPPGTLVVIKPVEDVSEINIGDIITYQLESGKPEVVTHRVVGMGADADGEVLFTTRGDANDSNDLEPVQPAQIVGKLWYSVPYIGWINNVVTGQARAWAIPIVVGALFVYGFVLIAMGFRDRRREKKAALAGQADVTAAVESSSVEPEGDAATEK